MPNVVVGGGAFEAWLGHEGRALVNGINDFIKETPENTLSPLVLWGHLERMASYDLGSQFSPDLKSASALIIGYSASRIMGNKCVLFLSQSVYGIYDIFVTAVWMD